MIDIYNELYDIIATALRAEFPGIFVTGTVVSAPPQFSAVSLVERSNTTYRRSLDGEGVENHSSLMWECQYFSNLNSGAVAQCRAIAKVVDDIMISYNFMRTMFEQIPNEAPGITRMVARYVGLVSADGEMYRV